MRSVNIFFILFTMVSASLATPVLAGDDSWKGLYGGLQLGGGFGETRRDFILEGTTTGNFGTSGIIGGLTGGYNWQMGRIVAGAEEDISGSNIDGTHNCPSTSYRCEIYSNWLATFRPRVGYAIGSILPYATAGLAVGDVHSMSQNYASGAIGSEFDNTEIGWTAGGGIEYALAESPISLKLEYLYVDLNDSNGPSSAGTQTTVKFQENICRIGLNYKFD